LLFLTEYFGRVARKVILLNRAMRMTGYRNRCGINEEEWEQRNVVKNFKEFLKSGK